MCGHLILAARSVQFLPSPKIKDKLYLIYPYLCPYFINCKLVKDNSLALLAVHAPHREKSGFLDIKNLRSMTFCRL